MRHCGWLLCLWVTGVAGQTLPQVTVSTTRTEAAPFDVPASVDVVDGAKLRAAGRPELQLSESLFTVPGVTARDRLNFAQDLQLSIRGFGARSTFGVRGVRLYVDGIPATSADGQGQLSHFDLSSAGRVEVLRGPFSALYGNSSGGVLQVFTEQGQGAPEVTAGVTAGSDGLRRPAVRLSGATEELGFTLSTNHMRTEGWRPHAGADRTLGNLRLDGHTGAGGEWMLAANVLDLRAQDPLGLTRPQFDAQARSTDAAALAFDTRKSVRQAQVGLVHEQPLDARQRLRLMVYAGERRTLQFQAIPAGVQANPLHPGGVIDLDRTYGGADLRWTFRAAPAEVVAGLGYDAVRERRRGWQNFVGTTTGQAGALRRDEDNEVDSLDPYLQTVWKPAPDWTVTAGVRRASVRFDSTDRYVVGTNGDDSGGVRYRSWLPAAGLMYAVSPRLHAYAAVGQGFETPTGNELAYRPDGTAGLNLRLRPSRSRSVEVGVKGRSEPGAALRTEWSAALFHTATDDELVVQTNMGGRSTFQNAGRTRRQGMELAYAAAWARGWNLQFAHTWLDARYTQGFITCAGAPCVAPTLGVPAGNRIPGLARHTTALALAWSRPEGWQAGADWRRASRVFVNDLNADAAPAYSVLALHAGYAWQSGGWRLRADARVDNLAERRYAGSVIVGEGNGRFFEPAAGRQFVFKLSLTHPL